MVTENLVLMIIKGLFRKYERWNPVHPTSGAFWGMGIGVGCGIGWGPGFGPEVIGYVGAGCGIGFSVGITLAGTGIGLPANFLIQIPYNVLEGARTGALDLYRCRAVPAMRNESGAGWNPLSPLVSGLRKEAGWKIPNLNLNSFNTWVQLNEMKDQLANQANSALVRVGAFKNCFLLHGKRKKEDPSRY